jgi:uncharacterized protein YkwD
MRERSGHVKKLFWISTTLLAVLLAYGVSAQAQDFLFSVPTEKTQITLPPTNSYVVLRQRLAIVQSLLLANGEEPVLYLNPFDDVHLEAVWKRTDRRADGGFAWFGHIDQHPSSEVVLVWDGSALGASATLNDRKYTVWHLRDGLHLVRELDLTLASPTYPTNEEPAFSLLTTASDLETEVLELVNQMRLAENLHPLAWDSQLHEAAFGHSEDMAANDYFSHTSLDGRTPFDRIRDAGYLFNAAGENIAAGYSTPQAVVNGWMNSTGHRQNILSSTYCDLGVGYAYHASGVYHHYWTQNFGRRSGVASCPDPTGAPPIPEFTASPISGTCPLTVHFDASASVEPEGGGLSFAWDFGDGQRGEGGTVFHTYTWAGVFTVTLTVTNSEGASVDLVKVSLITVSDPDPGKHVLAIQVEGQGTAVMNPPEGSYEPGTVVSVTAIPSQGWEFSSWSGELTGSENPASIVMNSPKSLTATFTQSGSAQTGDTSTASAAEGSGSGGGCFIGVITGGL